MMRRSLACIILAGLCCTAAPAEEQKGAVLNEWLKGVQNKIALIAPKKVLPRTTTVAGVRAAKEESTAKLYWKGKKGGEAVSEEELAEFKTGIDRAASGDSAGAIKGLEDFMKKHPDSALIPDAKRTLDLVKTDMKPASEK
ncbi:MAG TPA: hypothetical protein VIX18_11465 [Nitrospirota bacterium]